MTGCRFSNTDLSLLTCGTELLHFHAKYIIESDRYGRNGNYRWFLVSAVGSLEQLCPSCYTQDGLAQNYFACSTLGEWEHFSLQNIDDIVHHLQ